MRQKKQATLESVDNLLIEWRGEERNLLNVKLGLIPEFQNKSAKAEEITSVMLMVNNVEQIFLRFSCLSYSVYWEASFRTLIK